MQLERQSWTLLALAAASPQLLTPVQLQKILFLLGEELPDAVGPGFYEFKPYNYGPFSSAIYSDAESLQEQGLARLVHNGRWTNYGASEAGIALAAGLRAQLDETVAGFIDQLVAWAKGLSFDELVRAVYKKFPQMRKNSVWVDKGKGE